MNRKGNTVIGILLIVIGGLFFLNTLEIIDLDIGNIIANFWPFLFLMIPGLIFHYAFFYGGNRDVGMLVPGGILFISGITCQLSSSLGIWHLMWPGFIMAVAVGLFELYLFGDQDRALFIPIGILGGLSIFFFTSFSFRTAFGFSINKLLIPAIMVIIGLFIILKRPPERDDT